MSSVSTSSRVIVKRRAAQSCGVSPDAVEVRTTSFPVRQHQFRRACSVGRALCLEYRVS